MKELSHRQAQYFLQAGSPLPAGDQASLSAHLDACAECRAYADFHARLAGDLPRAYPARRTSERELRQKISATQAQIEKRSLPWQMLRFAQSALAMTAVLALVIGLGYLAFLSLPESARQRADQAPSADPRPAAALPPTVPAAGENAADSGSAGAISASPDAFGTQASQPGLGGAPAATAAGVSAALLAELPLHEGAAWRWQEEAYHQAEGAPNTTLRATSRIEERVMAVEDHLAQATLIYIEGSRTILSADEGWQEKGEFPTGEYAYWLVIRDNRVYRSLEKPDAALTNLEPMRLEYVFPLAQGSEWCRTTPGADAPCEASVSVKDTVTAQTALGELTGCYEIREAAGSVDGFSTFCPGVGMVAVQYAHSGTQSGYTRTLLEFSKDGAFSTPAPPELVPGADLQAQLSGEVMGVAWHGHTAYIGAGPYLDAVDLTQPGSPQRIARGPLLPDPVSKVIRIPDETRPMMLVAYGRRIVTYDISDPKRIDTLGDFILPGTVGSLLLDLNTLQAYAAGPLEGRPSDSYLAIVDLKNPAAPRLLDQATLEGPVTNLALERPWLYAGSAEGVRAVSVENNRFVTPGSWLVKDPVYSMTVVRGQLTIGSNGQITAYELSNREQPRLLWQISEAAPGVPLGLVYGFELRASTIYAAGYYPDGARPPFRLALTPPAPNQTGSIVDTSSVLSVGNGLMLVSGDRSGGGLEIYDIRDPQNFQRAGTYRPNE